MLKLKFGETLYEFDVDEQLKTLTGVESATVEEWLGGWERFRDPANTTRSLVVLAWLGKRSAGETDTLEDVANTPGLLFGDVLSLEDDGDAPEDPMEAPSRPLAETNGANGSDGGKNGSVDTPETSAGSGIPPSVASTV